MKNDKNSIAKEKTGLSNKRNIDNEFPKIKITKRQKIVFLGSEVAPFIATGGLSDVLGSLPKELAKNKKSYTGKYLKKYLEK